MIKNEMEKRYFEWKALNAGVYDLFRRFARERLDASRRFGMKALVERVRWESPVPVTRTDGFRLNDHYTAYLIRDLIEEMPGLRALVELRKIRVDFDAEAA